MVRGSPTPNVARPVMRPDQDARRVGSLDRPSGVTPLKAVPSVDKDEQTPMSPSRTSRPTLEHVASGLAVLVDYDGTIATIDVTDELVRVAASERAWLALEIAYREGSIGSRQLLEAEA